MERQHLEELLPRTNFSVYRLSRMAAMRALEISNGKPSLVEAEDLQTKPTTLALEEIKQGKVEEKAVSEQNEGK